MESLLSKRHSKNIQSWYLKKGMEKNISEH